MAGGVFIVERIKKYQARLGDWAAMGNQCHFTQIGGVRTGLKDALQRCLTFISRIIHYFTILKLKLEILNQAALIVERHRCPHRAVDPFPVRQSEDLFGGKVSAEWYPLRCLIPTTDPDMSRRQTYLQVGPGGFEMQT